MIYDICTFNGESELFDIRYNILKDCVDEFRIIEFDQTFSGKAKKPLFRGSNLPQVKSYYIEEGKWSSYHDLAISSPNTEYGQGAEHWIREFCQKESIKDCLTDLKDDDIVFIGDCDEIWDPEQCKSYSNGDYQLKLKLKVYSYFLNNRSSEEFWGTIVTPYKGIKNECLNHLRTNLPKTIEDCGWHFTSMGGYNNVKTKLTDSYTQDSYANPQVINNLEQNINDNRDFLGRNFSYIQDESEWPEYLRDNKHTYRHMLKAS